MSTMTVSDLMSTEVVTIGRNETLKSAEAQMGSSQVRHLPVIDSDGKLCGILSARDLFRGALLRALGYGSRAEELMLNTTVVKEAMVESPHVVAPTTPLDAAAQMLLDNKIGCLPVVSDGKLVGILSEGDFVRLAIRSDV